MKKKGLNDFACDRMDTVGVVDNRNILAGSATEEGFEVPQEEGAVQR